MALGKDNQIKSIRNSSSQLLGNSNRVTEICLVSSCQKPSSSVTPGDIDFHQGQTETSNVIICEPIKKQG